MPAKAGIQYSAAPSDLISGALEYWITRLRGDDAENVGYAFANPELIAL